MVEEAVVFGRQDGLQQAEGDVAQPYRPVVLAGPVTRAREDLGLERGGADVAPVARDLHDAVVARLEAHALRVAQSRQPPQMDLPHPAGALELPGRLGLAVRLRVGQPGQGAGEVGDLDVHAGREGLGHRVDERGAPCLDPVEARQLDGRIDDQGEQRQAGHAGETEQDERGAAAPARPVRQPRPVEAAEAGVEAGP